MPTSLSIIQHAHVRKDGTAAIYLRITVERQSQRLPLHLHWPPAFFRDGECVERWKGDGQARDFNLIIRDALAKANDILIEYRLRRRAITLEGFVQEYEQGRPSEDFIAYMTAKLEQRLREKEITLRSYTTQLVTLNHLKAWKRRIPFESLNERTAYQFEAYLLKHTGAKSINGRWGRHKTFKTYLNQAKSDRIQFINPYDYFRIKNQMGRFQPIYREELLKLWKLYLRDELIEREQRSLRAFLFVCLTGMRHGDLRRMELNWVDGEFFSWVPEKTRRFGTPVRVPASSYALRLLADEVSDHTKKGLWKSYAEQKQNEYIRAIGERLDLSTSLCFQVGRETFATLYMEQDGKLEVLASLMGHTTTKMSEKYIKIRDQRKKEEAHRIASFLEG